MLAETRKLSRERASLGETLASEMVARLEIMAKDVHVLTKKVCASCVCVHVASESAEAYVQGRLCVWA